MIGSRIGLAAALRVGLAAGVGVDEISAGVVVVPTTTTLTVALTDSADPVLTSLAYAYSLVVTNTGGVSATTVTATVTLDASLTYVSASGTGWAVDASLAPVITFTRATLAVGAAPTITVNVTSGGAAVTASSTSGASAANAAAATPNVQTTVVKLVSKDATSGIRCPATSTEWTDFLAYYNITTGNPTFQWGCQDAAGNAVAAFGGVNLTASGTGLAYSQAVAGWSRVALTTTDGSTGFFNSTNASLPDLSTTSGLLITYAALLATPIATRVLTAMGSTIASMRVNTTPRFIGQFNVTSTTGTVAPGSAVRPVVIKFDRTGSANVAYTDAEKLSVAFQTGVTGKQVTIGGNGGGSNSAALLFAVHFVGAAAELSDAQVKTLLTALGWAIPWS